MSTTTCDMAAVEHPGFPCDHPAPRFEAPATGDRVSTEWGAGTVTHASGRRVAIELDDGTPLNIVTGTPGYYRVRVVS